MTFTWLPNVKYKTLLQFPYREAQTMYVFLDAEGKKGIMQRPIFCNGSLGEIFMERMD